MKQLLKHLQFLERCFFAQAPFLHTIYLSLAMKVTRNAVSSSVCSNVAQKEVSETFFGKDQHISGIAPVCSESLDGYVPHFHLHLGLNFCSLVAGIYTPTSATAPSRPAYCVYCRMRFMTDQILRNDVWWHNIQLCKCYKR